MDSFRQRGIGPQAAILLGTKSLDDFTDEELREIPTAQLVPRVPLSRFRTILRDDLHEHTTVDDLAKAGFECDELVDHFTFCQLYPQFSISTLRRHFTPERIFELVDEILSSGGFDVVEESVGLGELRRIGFTASEIIQSQYYKRCPHKCFADAGFNVKEMLDTIGQHSDTMSHYTLRHCKNNLGLEEIVAYSSFTINMDLRPFSIEELNNMFSREDAMKQLTKKLRHNGDDVAACLKLHYYPHEFCTEVSPYEMMQVRGDFEHQLGDFEHQFRQKWFPRLKSYPPATTAWIQINHVNTEYRVYNILYAGLLTSLIEEMKRNHEVCRAVCSSKLTDMFSPVEIIAYFGDLATDNELRNFNLPLDIFLLKMPATCVRVYGVNKLIVSGLPPKKVRDAASSLTASLDKNGFEEPFLSSAKKPFLSSDAVKLICKAKEGEWLKLADYSIETLHSMGCEFEHVHPIYGISYCGVFGVAEYKKANIELPMLLKVFTMQELIDGWGDRVDFARHCRRNFTFVDLALFFSVEELVAAEYELHEVLQCSFELRELSKCFSAKDLCYKHLRAVPKAVYLNAFRLKDFYPFKELSHCFPLEDLMRNYDLAVVIDGIQHGTYSAMNIDIIGRQLDIDCTIGNLKWNGLTLEHIPKETLNYWNLSRLYPTFSMHDLRLQYGMVEIAKAFQPRELAKYFSLGDLMGHFSCCELLGYFTFQPQNRAMLLECLKTDLDLKRVSLDIGKHILRDEVPIHELLSFMRHRTDFKGIGLHLRDLRKMGLNCKGAVNLGYKICSLRAGGYTCEDIRVCGFDHVFAACAGFSLFEIEDAMKLTKVDRAEIHEILIWGRNEVL